MAIKVKLPKCDHRFITRGELRRLKQSHRRLRRALLKIMDQYVKAPGWAAPIPTPKLVWSMYNTAKEAAANADPQLEH